MFRRSAKIALSVFCNSGGKISVHYCVFESPYEQDIEFTMCEAAHRSKIWHVLSCEGVRERWVWQYCVFGGPAEQNIACAVCVCPTPSPTKVALLLLISKAPLIEASYLRCLLVLWQLPSNVYHLSLRLRRPRPACYSIHCILRFRRGDIKVWHYCVFEGSAEPNSASAMLSRPQHSKVWHLLCFRRFCQSKYRTHWCFQRHSRAYLGATKQSIGFSRSCIFLHNVACLSVLPSLAERTAAGKN